MRHNCGRTRTKVLNYGNAVSRDSLYTKKVWEPVEPQKRYPRSNSDSDVTSLCSLKTEIVETKRSVTETCSGNSEELAEDVQVGITSGNFRVERSCQNGFQSKAFYHPKEVAEESDNYNLNGVSDFSSSSSSDNCSSCLSEGDSNTPSSNHPNQDSSSTSDLEDSSQLSEGRQCSVFVPNASSDGANAENEKVTSITAEEAVNLTESSSSVSQNIGNHLSGDSFAKSFKDSAENGNFASSAYVQGTLPSIQYPNIAFPVFQGLSTVGYYHQNPVPWSTAPPSGLMTYPHPNHYFFPSPFGYGLSGDSPFCIQYGPVQHLASPFMNSSQIPAYQPLSRANCMNSPEQTNALKANGGRDLSSKHGRENEVPVANGLTEVLPKGSIEKGNLTKLDTVNASFSLFQFGGPVALSTYRSDFQSADEEKPAVFSCCHVEGDHACCKKDSTVEEYNLFGKEWNTVFNLLV